MISDPINFDELECLDGLLGLITFNNPKSLNALTLDMFKALHTKLLEWRKRDDIRLLFIHSDSPKAFCSGGDVKTLGVEVSQNSKSDLARNFFWWEYATDYLVHQYGKPIVCWMDGITMGGGIGIGNGASHRVVTDDSVLAMPELRIGFFPDVGASYFLNQLPEPMTLFLAWTGARLTGADAVHLKLADICLPAPLKNGTINVITQTDWSTNVEENHWRLSDLLGTSDFESIKANVSRNQEEILAHLRTNTLDDALLKMLAWNPADEWLKTCVESFKAGSPLSAHVTYQHLKQCRGLSAREVFLKDWSLAINMVNASDFKEGIRAVLVDKDQNPHWKHRSLIDVPQAEIQTLLKPRPDAEKFLKYLRELES